MKVFISVGMNGRTNEEIQNDIAKAKTVVEMAFPGAEVIDTFVEGSDESRLFYLGESIKKLGECDLIYICPTALNYAGCRIEYEVAKNYGIAILESVGDYVIWNPNDGNGEN